jgi:hypothetical protein
LHVDYRGLFVDIIFSVVSISDLDKIWSDAKDFGAMNSLLCLCLDSAESALVVLDVLHYGSLLYFN